MKSIAFFKSKYFVINENFHARALYFYGDILGEIKLQEAELSEYRWFELDDSLLDLKFAYGQEEIINEFLEFRKK